MHHFHHIINPKVLIWAPHVFCPAGTKGEEGTHSRWLLQMWLYRIRFICRFRSCTRILSTLKLYSTRAYTISSNFWQLLLSLTSLPDLWQSELNPCLVYNQHKVLIILEFNTQGQKALQTMQTQIHSLAF